MKEHRTDGIMNRLQAADLPSNRHITGGEINNIEKTEVEKDVTTQDYSHNQLADDDDFSDTYDDEEPTADEKATLRHMPENLPVSAWLVAVVELCERFTYYGITAVFQNYLQRPLDGSQGRGALGLGHVGATGLSTFFQFWCYGTSLFHITVVDRWRVACSFLATACIGRYCSS